MLPKHPLHAADSRFFIFVKLLAAITCMPLMILHNIPEAYITIDSNSPIDLVFAFWGRYVSPN